MGDLRSGVHKTEKKSFFSVFFKFLDKNRCKPGKTKHSIFSVCMIGTDIKAMEERFSVLSALIKEDPFSLLPVFALPFFYRGP
jgi:hypothetical protein